jgi:putative Holliday junction resolvase
MTLEFFPHESEPELSALAFDFGTRRIGVAFGQSVSGTARPLPILTAQDGIPDWSQVGRLIETWQPDVLVVGLPYAMDGSEGELFRRATRFGNRLNGRFHLPCYGIDERLSSHAAAELAGHSTGEPVDSIAARLILESWFAELRHRKSSPGH